MNIRRWITAALAGAVGLGLTGAIGASHLQRLPTLDRMPGAEIVHARDRAQARADHADGHDRVRGDLAQSAGRVVGDTEGEEVLRVFMMSSLDGGAEPLVGPAGSAATAADVSNHRL